VFSPGANQLAISTNGTGRLTIDTAATTSTLPVVHPLGAVGTPSITFTGDLNTGIYSPGADTLAFAEGGSEAMRIDSSGRLLVGMSTSTSGNAPFQVRKDGAAATVELFCAVNGGDGVYLNLSKSRGTAAAPTVVSSGDRLGYILFYGYSGAASAYQAGALIGAEVDGEPDTAGDTTDMPGRILFSTTANGSATPTERLRITSAGLVGIGTTAPSQALHVVSSANQALFEGASQGNITIQKAGTAGMSLYSNAAGTLAFYDNAGAAERARIDSSGRLLIGTSTARALAGQTAQSLLEGTSVPTSSLAAVCNANSTAGPLLLLGKSRGTAAGGTTAVAEGDRLGAIFFTGANGTDLSNIGALIDCVVDAEPFTSGDTTDLPSRLVFSTAADGAASATERLRITSAGVLQVADAGNIQVGTTTGTKIGTATTQKLGFYNATPVVQPTAVANATTAVDVITQLNALLAKLRTLGIIAT
jgi:hypothetical protein